jgi:hypothetical protein
VKQVQKLIGFLTYFKKFCRNFSQAMAPIRALTTKDTPFEWGEKQTKALEYVKQALLNNAVLIYPNES